MGDAGAARQGRGMGKGERVTTLRQRVQVGAKGSDEFYTPGYALCPLLPFLRPEWHIWEPCAGEGHLMRSLQGHGYRVTGTNQQDGIGFLGGGLFDMPCDAIVTNPPYSLKDKMLAKCYETGKPFALLLPLTALEGAARHKLYRRYGVQIILMDKRINFIPQKVGKSSAWFASAWFCFGLELPTQIVFSRIERGA